MGARWPSGLERWTVGLATGWSWVRIPLQQLCFGTLAIPFTPLCQCLLEETLKAVGPFYLVGSKRPHQSALEMCNLSWTPPLLEKDNSRRTTLCVILEFECTVSEGKWVGGVRFRLFQHYKDVRSGNVISLTRGVTMYMHPSQHPHLCYIKHLRSLLISDQLAMSARGRRDLIGI